jgi:acetyl esterase/lipase
MPLARHPFGWRYIYLRLLAGLIRAFTIPAQWLSIRKHKIHQGVVFKSTTIPSRDKGRNIKVHLYQPAGYDSTKPTPVLVNWHGSGFIIPSLGTNREFCSLVAARTRCLVFDVDYRKAPEHPFPAAIQDAEDIAHYLAANPGQYDASNIFLSGFSAGGNIALVTASTLGPERVKGVIVLYAPIDFTKPHIVPEKRILAGFIIPPFVRSIFDGSYMLPSQPRTDPRVSPILGSTENVPNHVYLACGNADSLYDPAVEFVERLKDAGHQDAEFVGLDCMAHAFDMLAKEGTEAEEKKNKVYGDAVDLINRAIGARG